MSTLIFKFFRFFSTFSPATLSGTAPVPDLPVLSPILPPGRASMQAEEIRQKSPPDKRFPSFPAAFPVLILLKSKGSPYYCIRNGGALFPFQNKKTKPPDFPFTGILAAPFYSKLKFTFTLRFVNRFSNIMTHIFILESYPLSCCVSILSCFF